MRSVRISRWWFAVPAVVFGAVFVLVLVMVFGPQIESEVSACFEIDESQELIDWLSESEDFGQSIHAEVFEMIAAADPNGQVCLRVTIDGDMVLWLVAVALFSADQN